MKLEKSVSRTMILAGTRPLPGQLPEVGKLKFTKMDLKFDRTDDKVRVVMIERSISPTKSVVLTIPRKNVRGVFEVKNKKAIEKMKGTWHLGKDVPKKGEMWGVVYVDKTANVVVNVEYSCALDELDQQEELAATAGPEAMFRSFSLDTLYNLGSYTIELI